MGIKAMFTFLWRLSFEHANHCRVGVGNSSGTVSADVEALPRKQLQDGGRDAAGALVVLSKGRSWTNQGLAPKEGAGAVLISSQHVLDAVRECQKFQVLKSVPQSAESSGTGIMAAGRA